ncbi:restriction endonuclease subunit S [Vibrio navarrensis]|uniref:restriction endonuclease subunit S n=1 Tax=Vibrio navarrensis TaxID=29495 RepID=UPI00338FBC82
MTNFSGENLNAACGGPQGGGMDSRRNGVAEISPKYLADVATNGVPVGYKQTEVGVIPEDWDVSTLMEITVDMLQGINTAIDKPEYVYSGVPILKANNVIDQVVSLGNADQISLKSYLKYNQRYSVKRNDFLFSNIGARLGTGALWESDVIATFAWNVMRIIPDTRKVFPNFLAQLINSPKQSEKIQSEQSGSGMGFIPKATMQKLLLPLPRLEEQTAIANALSDVDALISELEKLIAKKQAIKTATMQQLLTGRTRLPQFALREDGTPKGTKLSELGEIPEDWEVKTYGEVFTFLSTSTNSRADLSEDGDFGYVHYGDIHTEWNNKLDLNKERLPRISKNIVSSAFVMDGDLIMADASEDYEGIGKTVEVFNVGDKQLVAGLHTFLLRDKEKVLADGFRGYLHSIPAVKSSFDRLATGMKVYGISKNNLSSVCIPVPSLEEQTAIATILSDMDAEIQALEQRLGKTRQIKQGMMQELLTGRVRLISGELKMDNGK